MEKPGTILAVWVAFGVLLGVGMDNVGAGVAIGLAIGVAMSASKKRRAKSSESSDTNPEK